MSKHVFYIIAIIILAVICVVDNMRINKLQEDLTYTHNLIEGVDRKLDASIYKKDAQLLLMNQNYGNPNIHKMLKDSCYKDCMDYLRKYGKEETE